MIYISIIVPVYNSEKYIDRCIESLLNQTLKNIEIIIINDGSTDKSEEIIKYYSKSDKRVVLINKKNGGVSSARNLGIEKANGKYISFVDSDDWCNLDMFEILYNNAEKYNSDLTNIGYFLDNKNGVCKLKECFDKNVFSKDKDEIAEILNELPMGYSVLKLYRRDLLKNIRFNENINFGEDAIFVLDYIKQIKSISVINKCSYHYVKCNNESLSKRYVYNIEEFINEFWNKEEEVYLKFPKYRELRNKKGFNREVNGSILHLYNNYKSDSQIKHNDRVDFIRSIMNNNEIDKAFSQYNPKKKSHKIFKKLYKLKKPYIMEWFYYLTFKII